jgi:hypothetical protein
MIVKNVDLKKDLKTHLQAGSGNKLRIRFVSLPQKSIINH